MKKRITLSFLAALGILGLAYTAGRIQGAAEARDIAGSYAAADLADISTERSVFSSRMDAAGLRDRHRHINDPSCRGRVRHRSHPGWVSLAGNICALIVERVAPHSWGCGTLDQVHPPTLPFTSRAGQSRLTCGC